MIIKIKGIKNLNEIEDLVVRNLYGICTETVRKSSEKVREWFLQQIKSFETGWFSVYEPISLILLSKVSGSMAFFLVLDR